MPTSRHSPLEPVDPLPEPPALPGTVLVRPTREDAIDTAAHELFTHAMDCVRTFGDFHLALSGGSTPLPLYERLMIDPQFRELPWRRTHLWIVDERRVGFDDDRCNYKHIEQIIVQHSGIPLEQVHPIHATTPNADVQYERLLRETLAWREKGHDRLDYALLGMGGDAHTASLFPHSPALDAPPDRLIVANSGPSVTPPDRITMTYTLLNATRLLAVLVTGANKAETLRQVAARAHTGDYRSMPILGVKPIGGVLRWYLDAEAAGRPA
jgi:6-phosphogluconolactonase